MNFCVVSALKIMFMKLLHFYTLSPSLRQLWAFIVCSSFLLAEKASKCFTKNNSTDEGKWNELNRRKKLLDSRVEFSYDEKRHPSSKNPQCSALLLSLAQRLAGRKKRRWKKTRKSLTILKISDFSSPPPQHHSTRPATRNTQHYPTFSLCFQHNPLFYCTTWKNLILH